MGFPNTNMLHFSFMVCFFNGFCFGRKFFVEKGQTCFISVSSPTLLRLGEGLRLSEPEAPKSLVSTSPQPGLLRLGEGLRLGEPVVLFLFLSSVNSRNHQLD